MVVKREKKNMQSRTESWLKPKYIAKSIGHKQSPKIKKAKINLWGNIEAMK